MSKKLRFLFSEPQIRRPRSVQEIFDAVIDGGFYTEHCDCMCFSLEGALRAGVISKEEGRIADREISEYLDPYPLLKSKLHWHGLPSKFSDRLAIYRDWKNRP